MESLVKVLVYNLSLAICLKVKYNKFFNFNPKDVAEFVLEIEYKLRAVVRDDWLKSAMGPVNIVDIYMGYILCGCSFRIK